MHILLIEPSKATRSLLAADFKRRGWEVSLCNSLEEAARAPCDIVLYAPVPREDTFQTEEKLQRFRQMSGQLLIVLSLRDTAKAAAVILNAGADNYIRKPFHLEVLAACVRALHHRKNCRYMHASEKITDRITIDYEGKRILVDGHDTGIAGQPYLIFEYFSRHRGEVLSVARVMEYLGKNSDWFCSQLSGQIGKIETVLAEKLGMPDIGLFDRIRGLGYCLPAHDELGARLAGTQERTPLRPRAHPPSNTPLMKEGFDVF